MPLKSLSPSSHTLLYVASTPQDEGITVERPESKPNVHKSSTGDKDNIEIFILEWKTSQLETEVKQFLIFVS